MIPIVILAGGGSTRMRGRDKLLEDVDGEPLLRRQARRALAAGHAVFVALPAGDHPRKDALAGLDLTILTVPEAAEGMSGTMRGAVQQLPDCAAFMMLLGDLVGIETTDIQAIFQARKDSPDFLIWRGATTDGKPGHPIVFDGTLRPEFAKLSGDGGGEPLVKPLKSQTHLTRFADDRARLDLDTPEDWDRWRRGVT
ncbi:NTP transferase domain-containing protein [Yoonia sp. R2-816]|uniref:nucleotidyltransferase family protein n=1 Tax=Yoonia sp. R2-816 TaxID=3342638 RepID=UPI00372676B0